MSMRLEYDGDDQAIVFINDTVYFAGNIYDAWEVIAKLISIPITRVEEFPEEIYDRIEKNEWLPLLKRLGI